MCTREVAKLPQYIQAEEANQNEDQEDLFQKLQLVSINREVGNIRAEPELKLMLLRHWTLKESMQNSNYIVSNMVMWQEPGRKLLLQFLAKLSVPLEQAEQKFTFMKPEIKRELKNKILEIAEDFGLNEIVMHSFVRQFDSQTQVSATDMAYAISSLLEFPAVVDKEQKGPGNVPKSQVFDAYDTEFDNFWEAYDALDLKQTNLHLLIKGIELAKEM